MKSNFVFATVLMALLLSAACGPTYVQHTGYVDPNAGYVDNGYVQPIYDPSATIVIVGGQQGYYGVGHIFYPSIVVGGYSGYYDSSHHFVSSAPAVRDVVKTGKPLYAGPSTSQTVNKSTTVNNTVVNNNVKPAYGSGAGVAQRGAPTQQATPAAPQRPAYGSGVGVAQRGTPAAASSRPASVSTRPAYSSSPGSASRKTR